VRSGWFDEVMLLVRNEFDLPHPRADRFNRIFHEYHKKFGELSASIQAKPAGEAGVQALKKALSDAEALFPDYWKVISEARRLESQDPDRADEVYRQGVTQFPQAAPLLGNYANFLADNRKEYDAAEAMYKRAMEADPKDADYIGNYAAFLSDNRKDYDAAEAMFKRAMEADPKDAVYIGNYAAFLSDNRKDYDAAEAMFKRAIEADPKHAISRLNFAGFLLANGNADGLAVLRGALESLRENPLPRAELEYAVYLFAHGSQSQRADALRTTRRLLESGVRSPFWDLSRNVERARLDGHPEAPWLAKLAAVINDDAQPEVLNNWSAWNSAAA
jgi:Tfp pilus assembly protein PilF